MNKTLLFILVFFITSSCTPKTNSISVLEESSCSLPCWYEIVPGKTTKNQYIQIVEQISLNGKQPSTHVIEGETLKLFNGVISSRIESGALLTKKLDIWIQAWWTSDNVIKYMEMCGNNDKLNTTIGVLIEQTGDPEYIISGANHLGGKDVVLVNPKKGLSFWYRTDNLPTDEQNSINPSIKVRCIGLFDSTMYEEMLDAGLFSMGFYNAEETRQVMYAWDGYGNLDEKYPPRQP